MRLIDADKLKQHFAWWHEGGEDADRHAEIFEQIIDVQPTAQPEIIRCKDCKHRIVNEHAGEKGYLDLKAVCEYDWDMFEFGRRAEDDEWFCADAELEVDHARDL